ncbi:hypothetical protein B0H21DRAFT_731833 [Amylocystis lapponica]|nr:hypothetical protein B0H21DRAFT_731833 [Amylocystis lapponica]
MAPEIIDLTGPSPPEKYIDLASDSDVVFVESEAPAQQESGNGPEKRKRRKKRRAGRALEEGEIEGSTAASRVQSPERRTDGDRRKAANGGAGSRANADSNGASGSQKKSLLDRIDRADASRAPVASRGDAGGRDADPERREKDKRRRRRDSRSPRRDHDRERRSRSPDRRRRDQNPPRSPAKEIPLFFEDVKPSEVPASTKLKVQTSESVDAVVTEKVSVVEETPALLLPGHVSVFGQDGVDPIEILPPPSSASDDEDYIDYLDYDDDRRAPGMIRYFEKTTEDKPVKPTRIVCKNCGAEGEHKTYDCPVLICLTCGARDEHSTRSCPISKTCFTCGMKGHINRTCPNRYSNRTANGQFDDCDRCGARTHNINECPTLWRMYEYVDDAERHTILLAREEKRTLALGQGGEGYIASDEWCYNCGGCGHLGDDCKVMPHPQDFPREPSAFSSYNTLSGPFSDISTSVRSKAKRAPRDWEVADTFADGRGFTAPMDVGKQGRRKERVRMEKRAQELEEAEDDPDDWFGSARRNGASHARGGARGSAQSKSGGKKIDIGFASRDDGRSKDNGRGRSLAAYDDLPGPSRETDTIQIRGASRRNDDRYGGSSGRHTRDRERDRGGRRDERGPRYKGGYSR